MKKRNRNITKVALEKDLVDLGLSAVQEKYLTIVEHNFRMVKFTLSKLPAQVVHSRIASNLVPLAFLRSFDQKKMNYELVQNEEKVLSICQEIKEIIKETKITVSMHSSQFFSLASNDEIIRKNSQEELIYHAKILDLISPEALIIIQLNSKRELVESLGEEKYFQWAAEAVGKLPRFLLKRICLENEWRGFWNSANLYKFHNYCWEKYGVSLPLVWNNAHDVTNPSQISRNKENWEHFIITWTNQKPLFHWSENCGQINGGHCDYYHREMLPPTSIPIWICEVKMKELALQRLLENSRSSKNNIEG